MVKGCVCSKEKELSEIHTAMLDVVKQQIRNNVKIDEMHKALMGNGRIGLLEKWNKFEGSLLTFKFIATSGGISGLIALIKVFIL